MKEFIPEGDAVLCEPVPEKPAEDGAFAYESTDRLPTYVVIRAGSPDLEPKVVPGDVIVCDSTGNMFKSDGKTYHIFSYSSIIGKLRHEQN
jgi:hypothetical protein